MFTLMIKLKTTYNKITIYKKIIFFIMAFFLYIQPVFSKTIKDFIIKGNERVSDETIIMFSSLNIGDNINDNILNEAIKKIYYTDYFKKVEISEKNNIVNILVEENPIIQSVLIEGGTKTINHFLNYDIWDSIKVIKSNKNIRSGIRGPEINLSKFNMTYLRDDKLYEINR